MQVGGGADRADFAIAEHAGDGHGGEHLAAELHIAIGLAVGALVALFYAVTIVKLGPGVLNRPM